MTTTTKTQTRKSATQTSSREGTATMPAPLAQVCAQIHEKLSLAESTAIQPRYEAGALIVELADTKRFGEGAVKQVAAKLGVSDKSLYRYAEVAKAFTKDQIQELTSFDVEHCKCMTWSHLVEAAPFPKADRVQRLRRALEAGRSSRQLKAAASAGRPAKLRPATLEASAKQLATAAKSGLSSLEALKQLAAGGSSVEAGTRARVEASLADAERLAASAALLIPALRAALSGKEPLRSVA